jgi:hypothetical protein
MTNTSKHTPGPWRMNNTLIEGPKMALSIASAYTGAEIGHAAKNEAEWRANARLIAAAPCQNAALYIALDTLEAIAREGVDMDTFNAGGIGYEAITTIRAALAKAVQS